MTGLGEWFSTIWARIVLRLFPPVHDYRISNRALRAMQAMCMSTHPKEAVGVLIGHRVKDVLAVTRVAYQPFANSETSAHIAIDRYALPDMVGTFHSHPIPDGRPSAADKRLFAEHPGVHCILAYPYTVLYVYDKRGALLDVLSLPPAR